MKNLKVFYYQIYECNTCMLYFTSLHQVLVTFNILDYLLHYIIGI